MRKKTRDTGDGKRRCDFKTRNKKRKRKEIIREREIEKKEGGRKRERVGFEKRGKKRKMIKRESEG